MQLFSVKCLTGTLKFYVYLFVCLFFKRNSYRDLNPTACFKYEVEERIECTQSHQVKYTKRTDYLLPLPIPMEAATNLGICFLRCKRVLFFGYKSC